MVRRLRRHASLATLYRGTASAPSYHTLSLAQASSRRGTRVVKATLLPNRSSLPVGQVIGYPAAGALPAPALSSLGQEVSIPSIPLRPKAEDVPSPAPKPATGVPHQAGEGNDAVWSRLQTIFRRHQERQTTSEPAVQPHEPRLQRSSAEREGGWPRAGAQSPTINVMAEETGEPDLAETVTEGPHSGPGAEREETPAASPEPLPKPAMEPPAQEAPSAAIQRQTEVPQTIGSPATDLGGKTPSHTTDQEGQLRPTVSGDKAEIDIQAGSEEAPDHAGPLPLQAVWPVQRQESRLPTPEPAPQPDTGRVTRIETKAPDPSFEQDVRQVLQRVAPGQPTDSPVEVIMPRRPRPIRPQSARGEGPGPTPSARTTSQRVQRHRERDTMSGADTGPALVSTEIGPLPGDLWGLIGQQPPRDSSPAVVSPELAHSDPAYGWEDAEPGEPFSPPAPPASTGSGQPGSPAAGRPQTEAFALSETKSPPTTITPRPVLQRTQPQSGTEPIIQRQTAEPEVAPETGPVEEEAGEEGEREEIDTEELARQVYIEIKRRLAAEWERARGSFR